MSSHFRSQHTSPRWLWPSRTTTTAKQPQQRPEKTNPIRTSEKKEPEKTYTFSNKKKLVREKSLIPNINVKPCKDITIHN